MKTDDLIKILNQIAPEEAAFSFDNSGMNIRVSDEVSKAMVCVDVTRQIIEEADEKGCDVIISHHPLLFEKMKNLDGKDRQSALAIELIRRGINLYCAHTSLDCSIQGINMRLARMFGLSQVEGIEVSQSISMCKVGVYVPEQYREKVEQAMFEGQAGRTENYDQCSFFVAGQGAFRPLEGAHPFLGTVGQRQQTPEIKVEVLARESEVGKMIAAIKAAHPYEEPAIDVYRLSYPKQEYYLGAIGKLPEATDAMSLGRQIKEVLNTDTVFYCGPENIAIKKLAICGGAGGEMLGLVKKIGADAFLTGEIKYHEYLEAMERNLPIYVAGHYDTEKCARQILMESLQNELNRLEYKLEMVLPHVEKRPYVAL